MFYEYFENIDIHSNFIFVSKNPEFEHIQNVTKQMMWFSEQDNL